MHKRPRHKQTRVRRTRPSPGAALPFRHFPPRVVPFGLPEAVNAYPAQVAPDAGSAQPESLADTAQSDSVVKNINLTFTTIDVPGAVYTGAWAINTAGDIVGNYGQDTDQDSHGFLYRDHTFTYFDYPGELITVPRSINDYGIVAGYAGVDIGFLYDGSKFTALHDGSNSATFALGVNNAKLVVGGRARSIRPRASQCAMATTEHSIYRVNTSTASPVPSIIWAT